MLLQLPNNNFELERDRRWIIDYLSAVINGNHLHTFESYTPNENDETYWTIDSGNNWKVTFLDDGQFRVTYRYNNVENQGEEKLYRWLSFVWRDLRLVSCSEGTNSAGYYWS